MNASGDGNVALEFRIAIARVFIAAARAALGESAQPPSSAYSHSSAGSFSPPLTDRD
jgi:hypothetical protein